MGIMALLSLPWVRGWFYDIFIRTYQILTGLYIYGIWQYLPKDHHLPKLPLYRPWDLWVDLVLTVNDHSLPECFVCWLRVSQRYS